MTIKTFDDGKTGIAGAFTEDVTANFLYAGTPPEGTKTETYKLFTTDIPAYSVVGRVTATAEVVLSDAAATDGSQNPIGITTSYLYAVLPNAVQPVSIWYNGTFNDSALNWHPSYSTAALRKLAFEAKNPQITIKIPTM